jgi:Flp pilus assembly protein TadG
MTRQRRTRGAAVAVARGWYGRTADRGSAPLWALAVVVIMVLLSGAVLDGGNAMAGRVKTLDIAQQAARAGANQIDLAALRDRGVVQLDPARARNAAAQFLGRAGITGQVTATPQQVTVTVTRSHPTLILQAVGIGSFAMTATAHAVAQTGP